MKASTVIHSISKFFKKFKVSFLRENAKIIIQSILTLLFIGLAIWFVKHQKTELQNVHHLLSTTRLQFVLIGSGLTIVYIVLQGLMYKASFAAVQSRVPLHATIMLFLKRNVISVFLPAGGVSSLAFFTDAIEKRGISKTQIHLASSIYAFTGIFSAALVAIPAFLFAIVQKSIGSGEIWALAALITMIVAIYLAYRSIKNNGIVHRWLVKILPISEVFLEDMRTRKMNMKFLILGVLSSICIEFAGILLLYVSMMALHLQAHLVAAIMGYIVSVVSLIISPFLRGLGAVEVSMVFILVRFGFTQVEAISVTLLYRFFEFWLTLIIGIFSFMLKINKLLMRIIPAVLLFGLGIINIISVLTPAVASRLDRLQDFLPIDAINASNYFVFAAGLFMLITAAFMLKGLRVAWWIAFMLSTVSFIGHFTKAIDYEEAIVALIVIIVLLTTHKEYYIRTNPKLRSVGLQTAFLTMLAVIVYGAIGFYFLDKKHFNVDFSFLESVHNTLLNYFLVGNSNLVPHDSFARHFLLSIKISGSFSLLFIIYVFIRPYVVKKTLTLEEFERSKVLVKEYGNSGMDYFKTYYDKSIYTVPGLNAFISYRVSGNFAVVLENPVADNLDAMRECIVSFDKFCYDSGMKSIYYRVPEESLTVYEELKKKSLFLGQEGVIDLSTFTLEGGDRKTLRHAVNKVTEDGYKTTVHKPPVMDGVLQKVKSVSDEWLLDTERSEIIFSQGMFRWEELKQQTLITVENPEEKIIAFLNIIPDYAPGEGTYDLMRKTTDAPNGTTEFLLVSLCEYFKSLGFRYMNLGFAPMSGIDDAHTFPEKSMRFAYEKMRSFSHYKGLREFKERFFPEWNNKYLIYQNDYDLLQVPRVLSRVIKPID
jgi:phosphatidylglycerol lysyltransferase